MNRKAMGIGQVFIFIIAAVTFALIMIFGYKMVVEFKERGEWLELFQFKNDLENDVKKIYTEYGAVRKINPRTPIEYRQVCFVDLDTDPESVPEEWNALCTKDVYACDLWKEAWVNPQKTGYAAVDENVFLKPLAEGQPPIKVYRIKIYGENKGYLCKKIVKGSFSIVLEGKGDHTEISEE
jgi:hypothetical protein